MAATINQLVTVEEFSRLPEDGGGVYHELRHGEVVAVTRPKLKHQIIQGRLRDRLKELAQPGSYVEIEVPFRATSEYELRVADVGYVSPERWNQVDPEDYIAGAPDVVIEILSPSNSVSEMNEREQLCLEHGAREFWLVDPERRMVKVSTPDGVTKTWKSGQQIPLTMSENAALAVDSIFI